MEISRHTKASIFSLNWMVNGLKLVGWMFNCDGKE